MPFARLLKELVDGIPGADGAILADYEGESVAEALPTRGGDFDQYRLQLLGAHFRITLSKMEALHTQFKLGNFDSLQIRSDERTYFVCNLKDHYFVLLAVRNGIGLTGAEHHLEETARLLLREL